MTTVTDILRDLDRFEALQDEIKEIHDRWCGSGAFVHESKTPLTDDVYHGVIDSLHTYLGEHLATHWRLDLVRISRRELKNP